jgi:hypothetical protein
MNKEEIIDGAIKRFIIRTSTKEVLSWALDEYASSHAIAFADFLHLNYQPHAEEGHWIDHHTNNAVYSTTSIFSEFIDNQQQNQDK